MKSGDIQGDIERLRSLFFSVKSDRLTDQHLRFFVDGDITLKLLLDENQTVDKAFKQGSKLLENRVKLGIEAISRISFPLDFHRYSSIFSTGYDRRGNLLLWMRLGIPSLSGEQSDLFLHYIRWRLEEALRQANKEERNLTMINDYRGTNLSVNFLRKLVQTNIQIYPFNPSMNVFILNPEPIVVCFLKIARFILPSKIMASLKLIDEQSLLEFVSEDNLPNYLGGPIDSIPREMLETQEGFPLRRIANDNCLEEMRKFLESRNLSEDAVEEGLTFFNDLKQFSTSKPDSDISC